MKIRTILRLTLFFVVAGLAVYYLYPAAKPQRGAQSGNYPAAEPPSDARIDDYLEAELPSDPQIDNIVVYKSKRQLCVYSNGRLLKIYKVSLGRQPIGAKQFEGDEKTPEGVYAIDGKNPNSDYHKNLGVSYPNKEDVENAKRFGKQAGGDIKIHGLKNGMGFIGKTHLLADWTFGCIAVTDEEIDELYETVKIGTRIEILP